MLSKLRRKKQTPEANATMIHESIIVNDILNGDDAYRVKLIASKPEGGGAPASWLVDVTHLSTNRCRLHQEYQADHIEEALVRYHQLVQEYMDNEDVHMPVITEQEALTLVERVGMSITSKGNDRDDFEPRPDVNPHTQSLTAYDLARMVSFVGGTVPEAKTGPDATAYRILAGMCNTVNGTAGRKQGREGTWKARRGWLIWELESLGINPENTPLKVDG